MRFRLSQLWLPVSILVFVDVALELSCIPDGAICVMVGEVSILVFVDVALEPQRENRAPHPANVSILVFVDVALERCLPNPGR